MLVCAFFRSAYAAGALEAPIAIEVAAGPWANAGQ